MNSDIAADNQFSLLLAEVIDAFRLEVALGNRMLEIRQELIGKGIVPEQVDCPEKYDIVLDESVLA